MNFLLNSSILLIINITYMNLLLSRRKSVKYSSAILAINILIMALGAVISDILLIDTVFYKYVIFLLLCTLIIYVYLVFDEPISIKIFTCITVWLFSVIILIISSCIVGLFKIDDIDIYRDISMILRTSIQLSIIPVIYFSSKIYKEMIRLVSSRFIAIISLYSIIMFLFLAKFYELNTNKAIVSYGVFNSIMFVVVILLSYVIIFIAIYSVNKNMELQYKFKIIDTQIELQKQNYNALSESIESYYTFKHDIRYHILAIKSLIEAENYSGAKEYISKFDNSEIFPNVGRVCENFTMDSFLKYYLGISTKYDIDFKIDVNIPKNISIEELDLLIVLGNCIENSVEACKKVNIKNRRYIDLKVNIKGLQMVIKIQNSFDGQVLIEKNSIKTTKDEEGHGIGLSSVKKVTEKYKGYFNTKYNNQEFQVNIIINLN